ncbi:hypothetical protein ANHS_416 [Ligilactobacillus ruminis ATCC 25644]|nr:hypothetical protein ANHS_416 [Ligilactobacillus ruminis ATCC 25644]
MKCLTGKSASRLILSDFDTCILPNETEFFAYFRHNSKLSYIYKSQDDL